MAYADWAWTPDTQSDDCRPFGQKTDDKAPFRFEDLNGAPEPECWGPLYPKTASAAVEKWRRLSRGRELNPDEAAAYGAAVHQWARSLSAVAPRQGLAPRSNCASGQAGEFSAAKHRASLKAAFLAAAAADKRAWAEGKAASPCIGNRGLTIEDVYLRAMLEKHGTAVAIVVNAPRAKSRR